MTARHKFNLLKAIRRTIDKHVRVRKSLRDKGLCVCGMNDNSAHGMRSSCREKVNRIGEYSNYCLFVCLFGGFFLSQSRIFHSYGDVTIAGVGLQILTYALHSWSLSCEGSLAARSAVTRGIRL